jgi:hypothetical protein
LIVQPFVGNPPVSKLLFNVSSYLSGGFDMAQSVPSTAITPSSSGITTSNKINLLDLAAACEACMDSAIKSIATKRAANRIMSGSSPTAVTNANFTAQGRIFKSIRSAEIGVLGEESTDKEMTAQWDVAVGLDDFVPQRIKLLSTINRSSQTLFLAKNHSIAWIIP